MRNTGCLGGISIYENRKEVNFFFWQNYFSHIILFIKICKKKKSPFPLKYINVQFKCKRIPQKALTTNVLLNNFVLQVTIKIHIKNIRNNNNTFRNYFINVIRNTKKY